jgi:hypothetical protein
MIKDFAAPTTAAGKAVPFLDIGDAVDDDYRKTNHRARSFRGWDSRPW